MGRTEKITRNWSVRISNLPDILLDQLKAELENSLQQHVGRLTSTTGGVIVTCRDEHTAQKLLDLGGDDLLGKELKASKVDAEMSGNEIMDFIAGQLQNWEDTQKVAAQYGFLGQEGPPNRLFQAKEEGKGKGKGNKGSGGSSPKVAQTQDQSGWTTVKGKGEKGKGGNGGKGK